MRLGVAVCVPVGAMMVGLHRASVQCCVRGAVCIVEAGLAFLSARSWNLLAGSKALASMNAVFRLVVRFPGKPLKPDGEWGRSWRKWMT